jgi:hypothetical protein
MGSEELNGVLEVKGGHSSYSEPIFFAPCVEHLLLPDFLLDVL